MNAEEVNKWFAGPGVAAFPRVETGMLPSSDRAHPVATSRGSAGAPGNCRARPLPGITPQ